MGILIIGEAALAISISVSVSVSIAILAYKPLPVIYSANIFYQSIHSFNFVYGVFLISPKLKNFNIVKFIDLSPFCPLLLVSYLRYFLLLDY